MAENTTKDIWNDDDGEREEPQKKRHLLRNFLIFLLVLILVLGIVLVAAWRDAPAWTLCGGTLPTAAAPLPVKIPSISSIPTTATALRRWGTEAW